MQATKDYISLETAKLLKDYGLKARKYITLDVEYYNYIPAQGTGYEVPLFTWQEILWEYPKEFFGEFYQARDFELNFNDGTIQVNIAEFIMYYLQQGKCQKADEYFREHCPLINPWFKKENETL